MCEWHFWLATIGVIVMWLDLMAAGLMQGFMWKNLVPFINTVEATKPFWWTRALAGTCILVSEFIFVVNIFMTWKYRRQAFNEQKLNEPLTRTKTA